MRPPALLIAYLLTGGALALVPRYNHALHAPDLAAVRRSPQESPTPTPVLTPTPGEPTESPPMTAPPPTTVVTMTSVIDGQTSTGTATYALSTLSDYTSLRDAKTITTTATREGTADGLEYVAAVIPGGVAYVLIDWTVLWEAVEAPMVPQEAVDDPVCRDPKCSEEDCSPAVLGVCQNPTGSQLWCSCQEDETECPTDENDPNFPSCDTCDAGDDNLCTTGDYTGCSCNRPVEDEFWCIDLSEWFWSCDSCGGDSGERPPEGLAEGQGQCRGNPEAKRTLAGCPCDIPVEFHRFGLYPPPDIQEPLLPENPPTLPPLIDEGEVRAGIPTCNMDNPSRVQNNVLLPNDKSEGVYKQFCDMVGGDQSRAWDLDADILGNPIGIMKSKRAPPPNPDSEYWEGFSFHLAWSGPGDSTCQTDCNAAWEHILNSPCANGGNEGTIVATAIEYESDCGKYSLSITGPEKVVNPPAYNPPPGSCTTELFARKWGPTSGKDYEYVRGVIKVYKDGTVIKEVPEFDIDYNGEYQVYETPLPEDLITLRYGASLFDGYTFVYGPQELSTTSSSQCHEVPFENVDYSTRWDCWFDCADPNEADVGNPYEPGLPPSCSSEQSSRRGDDFQQDILSFCDQEQQGNLAFPNEAPIDLPDGGKLMLYWSGSQQFTMCTTQDKPRCQEVFTDIAISDCGRLGPNGDLMATTGTMDTGCGNYTYSFE